MRGRIREVASEEKNYDFDRYSKSFESEKRLDLNDLLKRIKDKKKNDKRINLMVFSGAATAVAVFLIILSL